MKKKLSMVLIAMMLTALLIPLVSVSAYTGGLVAGKSSDSYDGAGTRTVSNAPEWTDNNEGTSRAIPANGGYIEFTFTTAQTIKSYQLKVSSGGLYSLRYYLDGATTPFATDSGLNVDGLKYNVTERALVKKIRLVNTATTVSNVNEFDVFGGVIDYSGGLLDGKTLHDITSSTPGIPVSQATDNNVNTTYSLNVQNGRIQYVFPEVVNISSTRFKGTVTAGSGTPLILFYDAAGVSLGSKSMALDGSLISFTPYVGVKSVSIFINSSLTGLDVSEWNVYGSTAQNYSGGLLDGKLMSKGTTMDNVSGGTFGTSTDNNEATFTSLTNTGNFTLWYKFATPVNVSDYRLKMAGLDNFTIAFYSPTKSFIAQIQNSNIIADGTKRAFSVSNVGYVILVNTSTTTKNIAEFNIYESAPLDTTPPPVPNNLTGTATNGKTSLSWDAVTPPTDFAGYHVYVDNVKVTTSPITTTNYDAVVSNNVNHTFQVTSVDNLGNESVKSNQVTSHFDTISPLAPIGLTSNPAGNGSTLLQWSPNTEPDLAGYNVFQDNVKKNQSLIIPNEYMITGLNDNQTYSFKVTAVDTSANESAKSSAVTYYMDASAPLPPSGLSGTAGRDKVTLSWLAPPDEDLAAYNIYQNGVKIQSNVTATNYQVTGLQPDTLYNFTVRAVDDVGNESPNSNPLSIRTELKPSTTPNNVKAIAKNQSVKITWDAVENATDYKIYRDDVPLGTTNETSYLDEAVVNGTVYAYRISAVVDADESEPTNPIHARPGEQLDLGESGGEVGSVLDVIKTAFSFLGKYKLIVLLVLGIIFAPTVLSFLVWIMRKPKEKKRRGPAPLTAEEKEKRARERRINRARDDKYDYLTRLGRTYDRDRWVREVGYLNKDQREEKARKEREQAKEQRAAEKKISSGRTSRSGRTSTASRSGLGRTTRSGRGGRNGRK